MDEAQTSVIMLKDPRQTRQDIDRDGLHTCVFLDGPRLQFIGSFKMPPSDCLLFLRQTVFALVPGKPHIEHVAVVHGNPDPTQWKVNYNAAYDQVNAMRVTIV